jgi:lipopolysaccharide/colanic/teichoic acid biosynthesis glycosyltransferase
MKGAILKRAFDVSFSVLALMVLLPFSLIVALVVVFSAGFPILFRQVRVGRSGRDFLLYKFRTMRVTERAAKSRFEPGQTARITPVGRILRKAKVDELPQLWNVIKGDMSLVGPRPEVRDWVDVYPDRWRIVLQVRPGITDPASIKFRHEEEVLRVAQDPIKTYRDEVLPSKLSLYEDYVRSRSFFGDLIIIFKTIAVLFKGW